MGHKNGMRWRALYCRGAPAGSEAPGGRALGADVDRLLALAAPRRAALVTSRALRGVFWRVSACQRRHDAWLPRLRPRASGRARQARRSSARVFELAARDEPAWLVARRQPAQNALGILDSLAKLSVNQALFTKHPICTPMSIKQPFTDRRLVPPPHSRLAPPPGHS